MYRYTIRRLLAMVPTFLIISIVVFMMIRMIPGDITDIMVENYNYAEDKAALRAELGLDRPLVVQYGTWMGSVLTGNFGQSLWTGETIGSEMRVRLPLTFQLGMVSILLTLLIAIPTGVLAAVKQDSLPDYIARSLAVLHLSIPDFWLAIMIIVLPALWFGTNVQTGWVPFFENPAASLRAVLIPATILGVSRSASVMRMTRAMMLEVLRQDYIRTARSKGLGGFGVIYRHALKNAMIPVVTVLGLQIPAILGGSIIMESIFNLPGTGRFMLNAIQERDYPLIQATTLIFAIIVMFTNLLVDLLYGFLDPRIRYA